MQPPSHDFLTLPLGGITALHVLTLTLHMAAMNLLVVGSLAALWRGLRRGWGDPVAQRLIRLLPSAMAATITLGVAPLLFAQVVYGRLFYPASILGGWIWLGVLPLLVLAYLALYAAAFAGTPGPAQGRRLLVALISLLAIAGIYSSTFALAERPELMKALYRLDQRGFQTFPMVSEWLLRWLHTLSGAVTVGGFLLALLAGEEEEQRALGSRLFLGGMVLASLLGLGYVASLGPDLRPFMRSPGIRFLSLGILTALGSAGAHWAGKRLPSGLLLALSLASMVLTRHHLRLVRLSGVFDPATLPVRPDWGPFAVFLGCFVLMLATLVWMGRLVGQRNPD